MARIVVALGGNALGNTPAEQKKKAAHAAEALVGLIRQGNEIVVAHGNGPQVGMIHLGLNHAADSGVIASEMPFPECGAMSQGYIGYHLQNALLRRLRAEGLPQAVCTVVTQVEVDPADPAFENPTKPVGAFYSEEEAAARMAAGDGVFREDAGRGWRKVVPSPLPADIVEKESVLSLLRDGFVVIACGGGGIPVVKRGEGDYEGVSAVIDKDYASECLAEVCDADFLYILTAVDRVCVGFNTPGQRELKEMTDAEAERYIAEGQFAPGSMLPKVKAAVRFARSGPGRRAVICSLDKASLALTGESGTVVTA
ncbi:MAG: carbamate kinase [Oscillospiraceae bacterium]|nr:carbamate kinase [Oscillospiraceae bacterium]